MTDLLKAPLDWTDSRLQELVVTLGGAYYAGRLAEPLIAAAGIRLDKVNLDQPMYLAWRKVLEEASITGRGQALLDAISDAGDVAVAAKITELLAKDPIVAAPEPADAMPFKADRSSGGDVERIVEGQSTLLDIAFLKRGLDLAPAVCRLLVTLSDGNYHGTGFRIGDDLLLTNNHVLRDKVGPASKVVAWFGYELSFDGAQRAHEEVTCDPASIVGDATHDWAVVRTSAPMPAAAPIISLAGAAAPKVLDRVYIVQHPNGGVKKIGMIHNVVTKVTDDLVQYRVDTEGGSSGSPVFNEQWEVVALHRRWGTEKVAGRVEVYNEGTRIERVVEGLTAGGLI